jgi:hypothetical protein
MNKTELELRCLIDLSLTVQDYETVVNNAKYPIDDFKVISAFKYQTHCEEVLLFAKMAFDRSYLTTNFKEFVSDINRIVTDYHTKASSPTIPITKFAVLAVDFLQ